MSVMESCLVSFTKDLVKWSVGTCEGEGEDERKYLSLSLSTLCTSYSYPPLSLSLSLSRDACICEESEGSRWKDRWVDKKQKRIEDVSVCV